MELINNPRNKKYLITGLFLVLFISLAYNKLGFYVRFDFNLLLLLIVLPLVTKQKSQQKSIRYGLLALFLLILYPFLNLSSVFFFGFIFSLFFLWESQFGKLNSTPVFLLIIASPVFIFVTEIVGFEIRLYLTKIAAKVLSILDNAYYAVGNIIMYGNQEFHVDPECMGLKMVLLSLVITLLFISFLQRKHKFEFNFISIIVALSLTYLLVIFSNLSRIILITLFNSPPGAFSHELIGILSLIIYVLLPMWFVLKYLQKKEVVQEKTTNQLLKINKLYFIVLLTVITSLFSIYRLTSLGDKKTGIASVSGINLNTKGFVCSTEEHDVLKLVNDSLLIYVKPATRFFSADHSPIICWKGSGYKVQNEQIINLEGKSVYFSELLQGKDILYTTWWYDSGDDKTISQFRWRFLSLKSNKGYRLINVISHNEDILKREVTKLLNQDLFSKPN